MVTTSVDEIHPNLKQLSNSSSVTLHRCERRYELDKLMPQVQDPDHHLRFGSVVGIGVQELLTTLSLDKALWSVFLAWDAALEADEGSSEWKDKKTFWHALAAIEKFNVPMQGCFANFRLATLAGRPATEIGFSIDCGDGFFYRGFIDAVMIDTSSNEIVVIECKTTKFSKVHEAQYKNSGQALGYALLIDAIIKSEGLSYGSSYKVYYPVYKTGALEWEVFPFTKTSTKRALWIKDILLDINHIIERATDGYFPMRGESCYEFFRPCPHFGRCEYDNKMLFSGSPPVVREERKSKYDFHFSLAEIIEGQLAS